MIDRGTSSLSSSKEGVFATVGIASVAVLCGI